MKRMAAAALAVLMDAGAASQTAQEWQVWPCFGGGYVQNVVIAPSNPDVWYAYVDVGGPYRSDDAGRHWRPLHGNLAAIHRNVSGDCVRTLDVDPRDADRFVMCSGGTFRQPAGIFVSRDGGRSFRKTRCGRFYGNGNRRMTGLVLGRNPNNPNELVAGEDWDGVSFSADNGETWTSVGLERTWLTDLRYDRAAPGRIYACAPPPLLPMPHNSPDALEFDGRTYETGLFRSDDGGRSWRRLSSEAPWEICQIAGRREIVAFFPARGVMRSLDGGETWEDFSQGLEVNPTCDIGDSSSPGRYQAFGAGLDFYLVGNGKGDIYRRGVDDTAWSKVSILRKQAGVPEKEPRLQYMAKHPMEALCSLIVDPRDESHWLATDWFEIWETFDAGAHWTSRVDGIMQLVSFTVECDPFSEDNIIYGVADMGLFSSQDGGRRFWAPNGWVYACSASYSRRTPGLAMMCGGKGEGMVKRSTSAGRWWEVPALRGLPKLDASNPGVRAYTIANNPADDSFLILLSGPVEEGKGGIYRTANAGDDWEWFGEGLPKGVDLFKDWEWGKGGPYPQLYFGVDGSAVCYSAKIWKGWYLDRETSTWRESQGGAGICAADPFRPGRFLRAGRTLSESLDGGATFHPYEESDLGECAFVSFDAHTPNLAVAGVASDRSVAFSRDGGRHWKVLDGAERVPSGCSSKVLVDRKRLFYLSTGSGVFTRVLP